ncbi:hypothetical protein V7157_10785 [Neobacillus drentensis]|uniref:hypothetical protein n=1 Tax=Neobacillus drentensis TaxID=220684 RepID=UPI002FFE97E5
MKKIIMFFTFTFVFILSLVGCTTEGKGELTRIDVLVENQNDTHIQDKDTLVVIESAFEQIKWDDKVVNMARKADVKAVFFYTFDENIPETTVEYEIWFNENVGTATIVSNVENKSYGELDKENAKILKSKLLN